MVTLDYYHLCEEVVNRDDGNMDLIGIFDHLVGNDLPTFSQMDIILYWSAAPGEHFRVRCEMRAGTNRLETFTNTIPVVAEPNATGDEIVHVSTAFRLHNINISELGTHYINVFVDETVIRSIPFPVIDSSG